MVQQVKWSATVDSFLYSTESDSPMGDDDDDDERPYDDHELTFDNEPRSS